jgi:hypothetical protein
MFQLDQKQPHTKLIRHTYLCGNNLREISLPNCRIFVDNFAALSDNGELPKDNAEIREAIKDIIVVYCNKKDYESKKNYDWEQLKYF